MNNDEIINQKSLKPKRDYIKFGSILIAALSLIWNIYQGISNTKLRAENRILVDEVDALQKEVDGFIQLLERKSRE